MRELIYYVAITVDGFIAHPDGSIDGFPWNETYGTDLATTFPETMPAHFRSAEHRQISNKWFDVVLMGRNTYEVGLREGFTSPYPTLQQYVFSRTMKESPDEQVTLVSSDPADTVRDLKQEQGKAIWLCGGARLAAVLYQADLLDRLIVKVNPVLFGTGIPLFTSVVKQTTLELTGHKSYPSGHMVLHYRIR